MCRASRAPAAPAPQSRAARSRSAWRRPRPARPAVAARGARAGPGEGSGRRQAGCGTRGARRRQPSSTPCQSRQAGRSADAAELPAHIGR
eukprot:scaffold88629_cov59-Phaeocystis_antarctica.AAC.2